MMNGYGFSWLGMGFGGIMMLLFSAMLIALVVLAFRAADQRDRPQHRDTLDRAMEVLRERYARGEISKDDYERMRQDLNT